MKEGGKEKQEQRKGRKREGQWGKGGRDCMRPNKSQVGKYFMLTFNKPSLAHTEESNAVIDNYLDNICLTQSQMVLNY